MESLVPLFFKNLRWITVALTILGAGVGTWSLVNSIQDSARNEVRIEQYRRNEEALRMLLRDRQRMIEVQREQGRALDELTAERDAILLQLRERSRKAIEKPLGPDQNDLAPESLRELIRRLKEN